MSGDPFASGSGTSSANITDFDGKLLLLYVTDYLDGDRRVKTQFSDEPKDVVVADVHDVEAGTVDKDVYIFQGRLIGTLKRHVGRKPYLGRLGKSGTKVKGNAPWEFQEASDKDKTAARKYIDTLKSDDSPFA